MEWRLGVGRLNVGNGVVWDERLLRKEIIVRFSKEASDGGRLELRIPSIRLVRVYCGHSA